MDIDQVACISVIGSGPGHSTWTAYGPDGRMIGTNRVAGDLLDAISNLVNSAGPPPVPDRKTLKRLPLGAKRRPPGR